MSSVSPVNIAKQLSTIETTLKKLGFKIYQIYGHDSLERIAFHLELSNLAKPRIVTLIGWLGLINFGTDFPEEGQRKWASWILMPYNYGGADIYLSLEPRSRLTLGQLKAFANTLQSLAQSHTDYRAT